MIAFIGSVANYRILRKVCIALSAVFFLLLQEQAGAQQPPTGAIHGFVAVVVPSNAVKTGASALGPGAQVFLPNVQVTARNTGTGTVSPAAVTNPQGYFQLSGLAFGNYQLCVTAAGFTTACDLTASGARALSAVAGPVLILDHVLTIQPVDEVVIGTVTLSDHRTPCFWFRPSVHTTALTASASLLAGPGGRAFAGPVPGNSAGQFVLPFKRGTDVPHLHVECEGGVAEAKLPIKEKLVLRDLAVPVSRPSILAFDFTKNGAAIRRANPGETITATVIANDPDGNPLHYAWTDDGGHALNLPDAPTVEWRLSKVAALHTLHVQVSNGMGGIASFSKPMQVGANAIFFSGRVFNRQTNAGLDGATITLNDARVTTDERGNFRVSVPDAARFVLNVTKPGFALSSLVLHNRVVGIKIPLDPLHTPTVDGAAGGSISVPPGSACNCPTPAGVGHLGVEFEPDSFLNAAGAPHRGTVTVEAFQYDLTKPNPIPGDFGAMFDGKLVRLATFGAFHLLPRDAGGQPLAMAAGKHAKVTLPIQPRQRAVAPAKIPLFYYDERSGQWMQDGELTRSGGNYVGEISHFSVFNADTVFPGGACVKVLLNGFITPVTLDAVYYEPSAGSFHHNGFTTSDTTIGVERMTPNQIFTLTVTDSATPTPNVVASTMNSGQGLNTSSFPSGYDTDTVNYSHCNGPYTIVNQAPQIPNPTSAPYFLGPVFGGTIVDNSTDYQNATNAGSGGNRNTLTLWKQANGFTSAMPTSGQVCGNPSPGEACALYFNNGDLKFGRDMHCRVTNATTGATACYVSNFGNVGEDDAPAALTDAINYENSGQSTASNITQPGATVAMEYDPNAGAAAVQFWAYDKHGNYLAQPTLDGQGAKPMPDICTACHQGAYQSSTQKVAGAAFLPFDLDSFLDDNGNAFSSASSFAASQQTQFHTLNNIVAGIPSPGITPPPAIAQLMQPGFWYSSTATNVPFTYGQGAAQLATTDPFQNNDPLYNSVVKVACRTCHVAIPPSAGSLQWDAYTQLTGNFVSSFVCGPSATPSPMPHAEVPWLRFWSQGLSGIWAGELNLTDCQSPP